VRGENVLLLGEIDLDRDDDIPTGYEKADAETVHAAAKKLDRERKGRERRKMERLRGEGFEAEGAGEVLL
jgi:U6 snRNA-associated Sm-like protein LSm1